MELIIGLLLPSVGIFNKTFSSKINLLYQLIMDIYELH